jgi:hypothetical protein
VLQYSTPSPPSVLHSASLVRQEVTLPSPANLFFVETSEEMKAAACVGCGRRAELALTVPHSRRPVWAPLCRPCFERFAALVDLAERLPPVRARRRA